MTDNKETCPDCGQPKFLFADYCVQTGDMGCLRAQHANKTEELEKAETERDKLHAQLHRLQRGEGLEGDYMCPTDGKLLAALNERDEAQAACAEMVAALGLVQTEVDEAWQGLLNEVRSLLDKPTTASPPEYVMIAPGRLVAKDAEIERLRKALAVALRAMQDNIAYASQKDEPALVRGIDTARAALNPSEPLDPDAQRILHENKWDLYESGEQPPKGDDDG